MIQELSPQFRPMLASGPPASMTPEQFKEALRYPVYGTPKLDGIRCVTVPPDDPRVICEFDNQRSAAMTRSMKSVPNTPMRTLLAQLPPFLDGELVATGTFQNCQSAVMSQRGEWDFRYYVFDLIPTHVRVLKMGFQVMDQWEYLARMDALREMELPDWCVKLLPEKIERGGLEEFEARMLGQGYEGGILRTATSPYKFGRSTLRQQWMVKLKQFIDDEAVVIGYKEEMHNANEAVISNLGYKERTSHQANMVGKARLGALVVRHPTFGEFSVGSGFTANERETLWTIRESLVSQQVTFKYQPQGVKDAPRIPIFKGFRDVRDTDPVSTMQGTLL